MDRAARLVEALRDARAVELGLFTDLEDDQLLGLEGHFLEPPIWEIGHVGWFQEFWLLRHLDGAPPVFPAGDSMYDSFNVPYRLRWSHPFPSREQTLTHLETVLERCIDRLDGREPSDTETFLYTLVAQHEQMHSENLLYLRQTLGYGAPDLPLPRRDAPPPEPGFGMGDVEIPGGIHRLGAERDRPFVFDNEQWAHEVEVAPFRIARTPVTNAEYARFVDQKGYATRRWWTKSGWEWRRRQGADSPLFWRREEDEWRERRFGVSTPIQPHHPVCYVNFHEAQAWCAWAGRRLPTEAEWERAATGPEKRHFPWGEEPPTPERANLDFARAGTVDVRALPAGDSPFGCRQMIGNVWEWTSSKLEPYPGFSPMAYREYSLPYFGKKPVLRGGAWPTRSPLIRNTWRNFYMKHRRNIAAGFRTVAL